MIGKGIDRREIAPRNWEEKSQNFIKNMEQKKRKFYRNPNVAWPNENMHKITYNNINLNYNYTAGTVSHKPYKQKSKSLTPSVGELWGKWHFHIAGGNATWYKFCEEKNKFLKNNQSI